MITFTSWKTIAVAAGAVFVAGVLLGRLLHGDAVPAAVFVYALMVGAGFTLGRRVDL